MGIGKPASVSGSVPACVPEPGGDPEPAEGPEAVGSQARDRLSQLDGYFVHLDADVLDIEVMPAVDAPDPGGLTHPELAALLRPLLADPRCVGLQLTIYDPDLDPDAQHAAALTDTVRTALTDRLG